MLAMNCAEYYETYRACEWAGFLLATDQLPPGAAEILHIVKDAAPKALVFEAQYAALVDALRPQMPESNAISALATRRRGRHHLNPRWKPARLTGRRFARNPTTSRI